MYTASGCERRLRQYLLERVGLLRYHRHLPLHAPHSRAMLGTPAHCSRLARVLRLKLAVFSDIEMAGPSDDALPQLALRGRGSRGILAKCGELDNRRVFLARLRNKLPHVEELCGCYQRR